VDHQQRLLRIERQVGLAGLSGLKSGAGRRAIDMAEELGTTLRKQTLQASGEYLFLPPGPIARTRMDSVRCALRREMRRVLQRAGLPTHFGPHCLRHTFATLLLEAGASPAYVQQQLGHASIKITVDTYGAWIRRRDLAAVDELARSSAGAQR